MSHPVSKLGIVQMPKLDDWLFLVEEGHVVTTPFRKPLGTGIWELAGLLIQHAEAFGTSPHDAVSAVSLQCSYLDFGLEVPRAELSANTLQGYNPTEDFALRRPADPQAMMDMLAIFGPMEPRDTVQSWLSDISVRTLMCAQTIGARFQSILTAYRLLRSEVPPDTLATGLERWGPTYEDVETIREILERTLAFSAFPDERYPSPAKWKTLDED